MDQCLRLWAAIVAMIALAASSDGNCPPNTCGKKAICEMVNGNARCKCPEGHYGNPLYRCTPECEKDSDCSDNKRCEKFSCRFICARDSCVPGAQCRAVGRQPLCSCPPGFMGSSETRCYPECEDHSHCPRSKACMYPRCVDPCEKACGTNAECEVQNHIAVCRCPKGMTGRPLESCRPITPEDVCNPNRCGKNAKCSPENDKEGFLVAMCSCPPGYYGKPLVECRKGDCVNHNECPSHEICQGAKCINPCIKTICGTDALCEVRSHKIYCVCPAGFSGNPLRKCERNRSG